MGLLGEGKNESLKPLKEKVKNLGALEPVTPTAVTWTASAGGVLTSNVAHGMETGQLVVLTAVGGSQVGLATERGYYVEKVSATQISLSVTAAFVKEEWTGSVTSASFIKLNEIAETRAATELAAAVKGQIKDSSTRTIAASGACSYEYIGRYSAVTTGTLYDITKVTKETLAAAGSVEIKENSLDLNAGA